jgi:DNA polymerase III gamma/tau subunit
MNGGPRAIANEVEKLCTYVGEGGIIDDNVVSKLTPTVPSEEFFEPVEAFYSGDLERTLTAIRDFFLSQKEFRSLLAALQNRNRLLIQRKLVKTSPSHSWASLSAAHKDLFGGCYEEKNSLCIFSQNPWFVSRLTSPFSLGKLRFIQKLYRDTFENLLRFPKTPRTWVENMVFRAFSYESSG